MVHVTDQQQEFLNILSEWSRAPVGGPGEELRDRNEVMKAVQLDEPSAGRLMAAAEMLGVIEVTDHHGGFPFIFRIRSAALDQVIHQIEEQKQADANPAAPDLVKSAKDWA